MEGSHPTHLCFPPLRKSGAGGLQLCRIGTPCSIWKGTDLGQGSPSPEPKSRGKMFYCLCSLREGTLLYGICSRQKCQAGWGGGSVNKALAYKCWDWTLNPRTHVKARQVILGTSWLSRLYRISEVQSFSK